MYKSVYLSGLEAFYIFNLFLLTTVSLATVSLNSTNYQVASIVSVCLFFGVCLATMAIHIKQNFNLKNIKRKLGFKDRPVHVRSCSPGGGR